MGFTAQYPIDLRIKVLSEYKLGKVGYHTLAKKYGLERDTVRYWVLKSRSDKSALMDTKNKETVDETQKDIDYYKTEAEYWKAYAKKLEAIRFPESKKKQQSKQSKNCIKEDTEYIFFVRLQA